MKMFDDLEEGVDASEGDDDDGELLKPRRGDERAAPSPEETKPLTFSIEGVTAC